MKKLWKALDEVKHEIVATRTVLHGLTPIIKGEQEKIASLTRKINVLIETVEKLEGTNGS